MSTRWNGLVSQSHPHDGYLVAVKPGLQFWYLNKSRKRGLASFSVTGDMRNSQ
jgi:hypothetical protein